MSKDAAIAYQSQRSAETDPGMMGASLKAINAQTYEQLDAAMSADSSYPTLMGAAGRVVKDSISVVGELGARTFGHPIARFAGELSDGFESAYQALKGEFASNRGPSINISKATRLRNGDKISGYKLSSAESALYAELNRAAKTPGSKGELAREIIGSKLSGPDARQKLAKFARESSDPYVTRAFEEMQSSAGFFDKVKQTLALKDVVDSGSDFEKSSTSDLQFLTQTSGVLDSLKVIGQAQDLERASSQMGGGILRDNLGTLLKDPRYSDLASTLNKISDPNAREAALNSMISTSVDMGYYGSAEMARMGGSLDQIRKASGGTLAGTYARPRGSTKEGMASIKATLLAGAEKSLEQVKAAESGVDNSMYLAATRSMEAANLFYDGAKLFYAGATKQDINLVTGLSGQSTVNLTKPNTR